MKKLMLLLTAVCFLLAGCGKSSADAVTENEPQDTTKIETEAEQGSPDSMEQEEAPEEVTEEAPAVAVYPLPDTTMENLTDAILAVSFEDGDAYVDDTGKMQLDVKIYTYDKYDMVDISGLKEGDTIVTHAGEVKITSLARSEGGILYINGGLEEGGFDLFTDECGLYFETGFNDAKNWYEVGEATIRVSADLEGYDRSDPDKGEVILYPGDFLIGAVTNYDFTPYNTTVRVENGQIVELIRRYVP